MNTRQEPGHARPSQQMRGVLEDQVHRLACKVLALLTLYGYPGVELIEVITYNAFTTRTMRRLLTAWEVTRYPSLASTGPAAETVVWLLPDCDFAVMTAGTAIEHRWTGDLPNLPAVLQGLTDMTRRLDSLPPLPRADDPGR